MEALERMRAENPFHAEYVERLIAGVREWPADQRTTEVAMHAVRGIVTVGDEEWTILVGVFGEPSAPDWRKAYRAYGSGRPLRVANDATEATCTGCSLCLRGSIQPCPTQTGVWYANHPEVAG